MKVHPVLLLALLVQCTPPWKPMEASAKKTDEPVENQWVCPYSAVRMICAKNFGTFKHKMINKNALSKISEKDTAWYELKYNNEEEPFKYLGEFPLGTRPKNKQAFRSNHLRTLKSWCDQTNTSPYAYVANDDNEHQCYILTNNNSLDDDDIKKGMHTPFSKNPPKVKHFGTPILNKDHQSITISDDDPKHAELENRENTFFKKATPTSPQIQFVYLEFSNWPPSK